MDPNTRFKLYFYGPTLVALTTFAAQAWLEVDADWAVFGASVANGVIGVLFFSWMCEEDDEVVSRRSILLLPFSFGAAAIAYISFPCIRYVASLSFGHQLWSYKTVAAIFGWGLKLFAMSMISSVVLAALERSTVRHLALYSGTRFNSHQTRGSNDDAGR